MAEERPVCDQINIIAADMDATLAFYRLLGFDVPGQAGEWPPGSGAQHAEITTPSGARLEFDNASMARTWHDGLRHDPGSTGIVVNVSLASRAAVDERYAQLTAAGHHGRQPPYDAFWGARYAIVQDPTGSTSV